MSDDILVEEEDGIATVTFNRPAQRNAISYEMWLEISRIAASLDESPTTRVVVFRGAGDEAFSAGADIKDFDLHRSDSAKARVYASAVGGQWRRWRSCQSPPSASSRAIASAAALS